MEIYFVRHGETIWNLEKKFQGLSDSPLTEKGINQAKLLDKKLKNVEFDKFYSSPLKRANDTANYIKGKIRQEVEIFEEFAEISMGDMEGVQREIFKKKFPEQSEDFFNNPLKYNPKVYKGESFLELRNRVKKGLKNFIEINKNFKRVLVVSHGATLKVLFHYISGEALETLIDKEIPKNTSYTIVEYKDDKFTIKDFSNLSHLEDL